MNRWGAGFRIVVVCLLLLAATGVARAKDDIFSAAEKRALSAFETEEELVSSLNFTPRLSVQVTEARVRYEEHASTSDTDSDWDAWLTRGDLILSTYYENGSGNDIGIEIDFGILRTTTERENWDRDDYYYDGGQTLRITSQKNDSNFNGWELNLALGWIHDFENTWELKNLLYYGRRVIEFDRRNFAISGTLDGAPYESKSSTIADEKYTLDYLGYSPCLTTETKQGGFLSFKPSFAYVVRSEAYNDFFDDTLEGEGGFITSVEAQFGYPFTESLTGYIGTIGEWQYLEGNTKEELGMLIEWPDNDLYTYGLTVGLAIDF